MEIKVLGPGCQKCNRLYDAAKKAIAKSGSEVQLEKVTSLDKIVSCGVMMTPALLLDGEVMCSGRVPTYKQILRWIENSQTR